MTELKIPLQIKKKFDLCLERLRTIYGDNLVSLVLYGSAASGEFADKHSNLNLLIVLDKISLDELKKSAEVLNKHAFIRPLFLTEDYIRSSTDIFPIEFLDMKENYRLLYGRDVLKDLPVDLKNLRFQCEQELKARLINLSVSYVKFHRNKTLLRGLLFKTFISVVHISRNLIRLKGKVSPYRKYDVLRALAAEFGISLALWEKILIARQAQERLTGVQIDEMFSGFVAELEKLVALVDAM